MTQKFELILPSKSNIDTFRFVFLFRVRITQTTENVGVLRAPFFSISASRTKHTHTHIVYEHVMNRKKYREIVYDAELCNQRNIERDIHRPNVYFIRPVRVETVRSRNKCMDKTQ